MSDQPDDDHDAQVIDLDAHRTGAGDIAAAELSPEFSRYIDAHEQLLDAIEVYQGAAFALEASDRPKLTTDDSPVDIELMPQQVVQRGRLHLIQLLAMTADEEE